jgi:hypothetical protein
VLGFPENGGAYLLIDPVATLAFSSYFGSHFNLVSVDLAEWSVVEPSPATVSFNGIKADGSVVATSFTTDGVIDGTGPLPDFQTFYFDSQFRDLIRVESPSWGYAIDNVRTTNLIPEPASGVLLVLGLLGISLSRRPLASSVPPQNPPADSRIPQHRRRHDGAAGADDVRPRDVFQRHLHSGHHLQPASPARQRGTVCFPSSRPRQGRDAIHPRPPSLPSLPPVGTGSTPVPNPFRPTATAGKKSNEVRHRDGTGPYPSLGHPEHFPATKPHRTHPTSLWHPSP